VKEEQQNNENERDIKAILLRIVKQFMSIKRSSLANRISFQTSKLKYSMKVLVAIYITFTLRNGEISQYMNTFSWL